MDGKCTLCGRDTDGGRESECSICHGKATLSEACPEGHHICDDCKDKKGLDLTVAICEASGEKDPLEILYRLLDAHGVGIHDPRHHVMDGSALLTAYKNCGGDIDLPAALAEMENRGSMVPAMACAKWGCCGAAVSCGMAFSIISGTTITSGKEWSDGIRLTSMALSKISENDGPRCCKRDVFSSFRVAVPYFNESYGVDMEIPVKIVCGFSSRNNQCIGDRCPYHPE